ncbi:MAG TPA: copper resistance protein CopC [Bacilli bacterium]
MPRLLLAAVMFMLTLPFFNVSLSAHAVLEQATPFANSELNAAPQSVELTFNERVDPDLFSLQVIDSRGKSVTSQKAAISPDHKSLSLKLPKLPNGVYTVTYRVISADGHPVEQSYVFSIGKLANAAPAQPASSAITAAAQNIALWLTRTLYYFALLTLTGWIFWLASGKLDDLANLRRQRYWLRILKAAFLATVMLTGVSQISTMLKDAGVRGLPSVLLHSVYGHSLLVLLAVSVLLLLTPMRWKAANFIWLIAAWAAEAAAGHAVAAQRNWLALPMDMLHVAFAAIWAGGLFVIVLFWKQETAAMKRFIRPFSRTALIGMFVLAVSGVILAHTLLPGMATVGRTTWSWLLFAKIALYILVIVTAFFLRKLLAAGDQKPLYGFLLRDFLLMSAIVLVVGGLVFSSPYPANKPQDWQWSGKDMLFHVALKPNQPGVANEMHVTVRTLAANTPPKRVAVYARYLGKPKLAPISVPIRLQKSSLYSYDYVGKGAFFPLKGKWQLQFVVLDNDDNQSIYYKTDLLF